MMPKDFRYVPGSSLINDVPISNPVQSKEKLIWQLSELAPGIVKTLQYKIQSTEGMTGIYVLRTEVLGAGNIGEAYQSKQYGLSIPLNRLNH